MRDSLWASIALLTIYPWHKGPEWILSGLWSMGWSQTTHGPKLVFDIEAKGNTGPFTFKAAMAFRLFSIS